MPLLPPSKLPPVPELGSKTFWDYLSRRSMRRVFFMLLALAAVIYLKCSKPGSFGGLFDTPGAAGNRGDDSGPVYHLKVEPPRGAPPPQKAPAP
jgi:hypothetical protein